VGYGVVCTWHGSEGLPEARIEEARWLGALIETIRPRVIYLPSPIDFHPDHAGTNDLLALTLRRGAPAPDQVAAFEVWSPILPDRLIDISATLEAKRRAIAAFPSQTGRSNIEGASLGIAAYRGLGRAGCRAAEAFWMSPAGPPVEHAHRGTPELRSARRNFVAGLPPGRTDRPTPVPCAQNRAWSHPPGSHLIGRPQIPATAPQARSCSPRIRRAGSRARTRTTASARSCQQLELA